MHAGGRAFDLHQLHQFIILHKELVINPLGISQEDLLYNTIKVYKVYIIGIKIKNMEIITNKHKFGDEWHDIR